MRRYDTDTLQALLDGTLPFDRLHGMLSDHKDADRFRAMLALHQEAVPWGDRILIPYGEHLYVVQRPDGARIVKCRCGHEFCEVTRNWKLEALVHLRDTEERLRELYPAPMHCDPEWMNLREYLCPGCATLLEVEAVPPGYPVVFDFQPDLDGFYRDWLGEPLDPAPSG